MLFTRQKNTNNKLLPKKFLVELGRNVTLRLVVGCYDDYRELKVDEENLVSWERKYVLLKAHLLLLCCC
jgi:hypothetical protein